MAGTITRLQLQARNRERVNLYLDGKFAFGLAAASAGNLQTGQKLTDEEIAALREADVLEAAYAKALRFLSYRPRSEAEMRRYLEGKGLGDADLTSVLERLTRSGWVDDQTFAQTWVENREVFRPRSRRALAAELRQKGVPTESIQSAIAPVNEEAAARRAAEGRVRRLKNLPWPEFRNRLSSYLARRGFGYEVIAPIVREMWQQANAGKESEG